MTSPNIIFVQLQKIIKQSYILDYSTKSYEFYHSKLLLLLSFLKIKLNKMLIFLIF